MSQPKLYKNTVGPPAALEVKITPGATGLDCTLITAANIMVKKPDGTLHTWTGVLSTGSNFPGVPAPTATAMYVVHVYEAGDLDQANQYVAWATSIQPSATFPQADMATFFVSER